MAAGEVAVSQQRAGAALEKKGEMAAALDRFKAALAASSDLAEKEPGKGSGYMMWFKPNSLLPPY